MKKKARKEKIMNWKTMSIAHKIATIISVIAVLVWVVYKVRPALFPIDPTCPAIAVFTACEAVVYWKNKRVWAYILIAGAVISMACFLLELMI